MSRARNHLFFAAGTCAALLFVGALALADAGAPSAAAPSNEVVAKVGSRELTKDALQARLAEIPFFQIEMMGKTEAEAVRHVVEETFVRESLLVFGAEARGITTKQPALNQLMRVRANATLRALRAQMPSASTLPKEALQRYYDENRTRYESPERIAVSRILVATAAEAEAVIAAFKSNATYTNWEKLARDKSIDKATSMRGGNLGFLAPDGHSNEAGVTAPPELVRAASTVRDGELVPAAVKEGDGFAVLWRRGTRAAQKRTFAEAESEIRELVQRANTERKTKAHIEALRKGRVTPIDEAALALAEPPPPDAVLREKK